jgi:multicopper oxidase
VRHCIAFLFFVPLLFAQSCLAATRHYYIAAEDVTWNYAPSGVDLIHGRPIPDPWVVRTKWPKTRYIEYTDATFSVKKPQPEWLGILGPAIRAEVGDSIIVDFLNRSRVSPHSIHTHGLRYDKANEGSFYLPGGSGGSIAPGGRFTYHWLADKDSGPGKNDPSSLVWWYHGGTDEPVETNAGLLGPIIVTAKGKAKPDGSPKDVDREFIALFMVFDELGGQNAGLFHTINGYIFGNLPGLIMKQGERVRWYLLGMGNERDLHTPHWHGKVVQYRNRHTDVIELLPGSMAVADMVADNPGTWMFHCHVADHMESGMMANYTIYGPQPSCASPVQLVSADFWSTPGKFTLTVKNVSSKPIQKAVVTYDHLMTSIYRRRPFENYWTLNQTIQPGQQETFEFPGYPRGADEIAGWVLYPQMVTFSDGSHWDGGGTGECYKVFWRDKDHPQLPVLPPLFIETKED